MEDGIVEFVEKLSLRFGLVDDNTQICLQSGSLMADMAVLSNRDIEHFRVGR